MSDIIKQLFCGSFATLLMKRVKREQEIIRERERKEIWTHTSQFLYRTCAVTASSCLFKKKKASKYCFIPQNIMFQIKTWCWPWSVKRKRRETKGVIYNCKVLIYFYFFFILTQFIILPDTRKGTLPFNIFFKEINTFINTLILNKCCCFEHSDHLRILKLNA